jgi:cobalt-zinc-cadmium efflux system outer membrane protein
MLHFPIRVLRRAVFAVVLSSAVCAQQSASQGPAAALSWQQIKDKFQAGNPNLRAAQIGIDESRANEITAYLRPNPDLSVSADGLQIAPYQGVWRPLSGVQAGEAVSYLHERRHKRELRLESARTSTDVASSSAADQERGLLFTLRNAFVQALQAKALLQNANENLAYWDRELEINRSRLTGGDIARVDMSRLELVRVQFETDIQTSTVNLKTSKIALLQLLNDRTPVDQFDVTGPYDFTDQLTTLDEYRNAAMAARPDLKAAMQSVALATTNHTLAIANGSTDPTFSVWATHNPSFNNPFAYNTLGFSVSIPLRIFDRNQGEKERTLLDIGKNERLREAAEAQVFSDVDSSYWTITQALNLLRPYKAKYLPLAVNIRDTVAFSYRSGGASLLDFLDAEKAVRDTRLAYLNLIGSYLVAAAQMNMAVGREVIQ